MKKEHVLATIHVDQPNIFRLFYEMVQEAEEKQKKEAA